MVHPAAPGLNNGQHIKCSKQNQRKMRQTIPSIEQAGTDVSPWEEARAMVAAV